MVNHTWVLSCTLDNPERGHHNWKATWRQQIHTVMAICWAEQNKSHLLCQSSGRNFQMLFSFLWFTFQLVIGIYIFIITPFTHEMTFSGIQVQYADWRQIELLSWTLRGSLSWNRLDNNIIIMIIIIWVSFLNAGSVHTMFQNSGWTNA